MALYAIGECLIDFIPNQSGAPDDDSLYRPAVGGAPLNVAAAYAKMGGSSYILSQVGDDDFGRLIERKAAAVGVDTRYLRRSSQAKTGLAFVSLLDNGERSFSFYRSPSADMLYQPEYVDEIAAQAGDILHFCSVALMPSPMREAHRRAIERFRAAGGLISFDVNVRLPLWENPQDLYQAIWDFLPLADIVKISDDELAFVSDCEKAEEGMMSLFVGAVRHVILTAGAQGASYYQATGKTAAVESIAVKAVDATGAGDAFIGTFLAHWHSHHHQMSGLLHLAAAAGAMTTLQRGAINSIPTRSELDAFLKEHSK